MLIDGVCMHCKLEGQKMLNINTLLASLLCRTRHAFLVFVVCFGTSIVAGTGLVSLALSPKAHADTALTLDAAIELAKQNDLWIEGSYHRENALLDESFSSSSLPDPRVSLSAGNFPVDTLDQNQEPMTQVVLGVTQMFPRGDSLSLSARQKREIASQEPLLRADRSAKVASIVTQLWLTGYQAQQSIRLIEQDRFLFQQLIEATRANYVSTLGRARQQDVIQAQLELMRLDDRLAQLKSARNSAQQQLSEWIGTQAYQSLSNELPELAMQVAPVQIMEAHTAKPTKARTDLYELIKNHPSLLALRRRLQATDTSIAIAKQKYKPEWGITASYGYRADDLNGNDRADLASLGVTFDLPIFTGNRQDREVSAAKYRNESLKTDEQLLARQLMSQLGTVAAQLDALNEREKLYSTTLLPQMKAQSDAVMSAYNNDDGDFAEAVRAQISLLNTKIEALNISVSKQKAIATMNYLTVGNLNEY
jgi:outer membrane protein TolC